MVLQGLPVPLAVELSAHLSVTHRVSWVVMTQKPTSTGKTLSILILLIILGALALTAITTNARVLSASGKVALAMTVIHRVLVLGPSARILAVSAKTAGQVGSAKETIVKRSDALARTATAPVFVLEKTVSR